MLVKESGGAHVNHNAKHSDEDSFFGSVPSLEFAPELAHERLTGGDEQRAPRATDHPDAGQRLDAAAECAAGEDDSGGLQNRLQSVLP